MAERECEKKDSNTSGVNSWRVRPTGPGEGQVTYAPSRQLMAWLDKSSADRTNARAAPTRYEMIEPGSRTPWTVTSENVVLMSEVVDRTFANFRLHQSLMTDVMRSRWAYTEPTDMQSYVMPLLMADRDMLVGVYNGSGKLAAFLLSVISRMLSSQIVPARYPHPHVLIVATTHENANLIYDVARELTRNLPYHVGCCLGNSDATAQRNVLRAGCDILVATPGRLNHFIRSRAISLQQVRYVLLNDFNRMLNNAIQPLIKHLAKLLPPERQRQTVMFTYPFPDEIHPLAAHFSSSYVMLRPIPSYQTLEGVTQTVVHCERSDEKPALLTQIVAEGGPRRTIIYARGICNVIDLAARLTAAHFSVATIHSDQLPVERARNADDFRTGQNTILVSTPGILRVLDFAGVQHVVLYSLPSSVTDYVHRIKRSKTPLATSFYARAEDDLIASQLAEVLRMNGQPVPDFLQNDGVYYLGNLFGEPDET